MIYYKYDFSTVRLVKINIKEEYEQNLKSLAFQLGYIRGDEGNPTGLLNAIAAGEVKIAAEGQAENNTKIIQQLIDQGNYELALDLSKRIPNNYQFKLLVTDLQKFISSQQPFKLIYVDAVGKTFEFEIHYAEISWHERRYYLDIWYPNQTQDQEPLASNRCLRLDRIPDNSKLIPIEAQWHKEGLDTIEIEFNLFGPLAYAFTQKSGDRCEWIDENTVKVTRSISSIFWFLREFIRYGKASEILQPSFLREQLIDQLEKTLNRYKD